MYNCSKFYSSCFKPKCSIFNRTVFTLSHLNISTVNQWKDLLIIISENNCALDLKRQMCELRANVNMFIRKFSRCSPDVKYFIFKYYCFNLYCSILWYDKTTIKTLRIAYNNSLRKLLGIPKYNRASELMFVCLNIYSFDELVRRYVYYFRNRLVSSQNNVLISICSSTVLLYFIILGWWESILTL